MLTRLCLEQEEFIQQTMTPTSGAVGLPFLHPLGERYKN